MDAEKLRDKCHLFYSMNAIRLYNGNPTYNANFEPFSKKTTTTTIDDIFYKTGSTYKKDHNKKYLQSLFPYIAMRNLIVDLEGNIVFCSHFTDTPASRYTNTVSMNKEFFEKYEEYINRKFAGYLYDIYEGKDLFDKFYQKYIFNGLSDLSSFKEYLSHHLVEKIRPVEMLLPFDAA